MNADLGWIFVEKCPKCAVFSIYQSLINVKFWLY